MTNFSNYIRTNNELLTQSDILELPINQLLGVDTAAAEMLNSLGINTVFDLGSSWLFAKAKKAAEFAKEDNISQRVGLIPSDWLDSKIVLEELSDIASLPLENLSGISAERAIKISNVLGVTTIHDFAFWLPYRTASNMVSEASGSTLDIEEEKAEKLRPRLGDYPTERVYYDRLIMLQLDTDDAVKELEGPISITPAIDTPLGFGKPAIGAFLTYSQSWYTKAITLGQMLHSLALAPGEATRIAIVDWSRRTSTSATEAISEAEKLDNSTEHSRAMSEVTKAVAKDMQEGGSTTSGWADSSSESTADSGSSGLLTSLVNSGGFSDTTQSSQTESGAESTSWSNGNKSVMANMTQDINDRTEQHSNSVRNRRASAVREVSQTEHEEVSTRIVANYNHMHALTIQYYEVVQVYQVETQLHKAVRCLFIPVEMLDFRGESGLDIVERFRGILLNGALNRTIRNILIDDSTTVEVTPLEKAVFIDTSSTPRTAVLPERAAATALTVVDTTTAGVTPTDVTAAGGDEPKPFSFTGNFVWNRIEVENTSAVLGRGIVRADSNSLHLPDETELVGMSFENLNLVNIKLDTVGASNKTFPVTNPDSYAEVPAGVYLREIDSISVKRASDDSLNSGFMILHCSYFGRRFKVPAMLLKLQLGTAMQKVVNLKTDKLKRQNELLAHLQANHVHYSQTVFRSLDSVTLVTLLSKFKLNGKALIDQVEPKVLAVAGNYLVLRAPIDDEEASGVKNDSLENLSWNDVLSEREIKFDKTDKRLVPIPTSGVFAEAVLGRSNSAEKLDITRFWNWQDSPIPLQPPEISPVGMGSRATPENLTPGQLSSPLLNIVNPTSLPDPTGISSGLNALTSANLFRDMSGLAGTQTLAELAASGTLSAATSAGELASANLKTEAEKAVAMGQIASDIAKTAMGIPPTGGNSGISGDGAKINHGKDMDDRLGISAMSENGGSFANPLSTSGQSSGGDLMSGPASTMSLKSSREAAYADKSALGYSPGALGAVSKLVGAAGVQNASFQTTKDLSTEELLFCESLQREKVYWSNVVNNIATIADHEFTSTWNNGRNTEVDAVMHPIIQQYFQEPTFHGLSTPSNPHTRAWSAVFIAWVMGEAGGADRFGKFHDELNYRPNFRPRAHTKYLTAAVHNETVNSKINPFWGYDITTLPAQVGDIIIRDRPTTNIPEVATFNNFEGTNSHGDIIVSIDEEAGTFEVIGGNKGGPNCVGGAGCTVNRVPGGTIDSRGFVLPASAGGGHNWFALIRINMDIFENPRCEITTDRVLS